MSCQARSFCLIAVILLTACGGGGSGNDNGDTGTAPPTTPTPNATLALSADNTPQTVEALRAEGEDSAYLFDEIRNLYASPLPTFTLPDTTETVSCGLIGSTIIKIQESGRKVSQTYNNCQDDSGTKLNGSLNFSFSNVNVNEQSFTLTIDYQNFTTYLDDNATKYQGTTIVDATIDQNQIVYLDIVSNRSTDDQKFGEPFRANNLHISLAYAQNMDNFIAMGETSGSLIFENSGQVDISWDRRRHLTKLTGANNTSALAFYNRDRFAIGLDDGSNVNKSIAVQSIRIDSIQAYGAANVGPVFSEPGTKTFTESPSLSIGLEEWFFDENFDVLVTDFSIISSPSSATPANLEVSDLFSLELASAPPGEYELNITVEDPDGLRASGNIVFEILADTDFDGIPNEEDDDDDNDGVADYLDAFPLDNSESKDSDHDGIGNNEDLDDDNDQILDTNDYFPLDSMCSSSADGEIGACMSEIIIDSREIVADSQGTLYFLVPGNNKIYRWASESSQFLAPLNLQAVSGASTATDITLSTKDNALYVGYESGHITRFDTSAGQPAEQSFHMTSGVIGDITMAGDFLFAEVFEPQIFHLTIDSSGNLADRTSAFYHSQTHTWNAEHQRLFSFQDGISPPDLLFEEIDETSGQFGENGDSPYHGDYAIGAPIVVMDDGNSILIGSGNIFDAKTLIRAGAIEGNISAAVWTGDDLIALRNDTNHTGLERTNRQFQTLEEVVFRGVSKAVFNGPDAYLIVLSMENRIQVVRYIPNDDSDGDGVVNSEDDFPGDPAASHDSDHDGFPDGWNGGYDETDSISGLELDHYPYDSACARLEDGDGTQCDYASVIPAFTPDAVTQGPDGILYFLSANNNRIYRWSPTAQSYIPPIVVEESRSIPTTILYGATSDRLYLGYDTGKLAYFDSTIAGANETYFATASGGVRNLIETGEYLVAQSLDGSISNFDAFDINGNLTASYISISESRVLQWNPHLQRMYFLWDWGRYNRIYQFKTDPSTGLINSVSGHSENENQLDPPILLSPDGARLLLGSGGVYDADSLLKIGDLIAPFNAGVWLESGEIAVLSDVNNGTELTLYHADFSQDQQDFFVGSPVGVYYHSGSLIVITQTLSGLEFFPVAL